MRIEGYGTYRVTVQTEGYPDGRIVTFSNVAYVPTFGTSVISLRLLNQHSVYWVNRLNCLVYGEHEVHFAATPMQFHQWVLEYNPVTQEQLASYHATTLKAHSSRHPRPINNATLDQWHEIMGHLYPEALLKMREYCQGVSISTTQASKSSPIETEVSPSPWNILILKPQRRLA